MKRKCLLLILAMALLLSACDLQPIEATRATQTPSPTQTIPAAVVTLAPAATATEAGSPPQPTAEATQAEGPGPGAAGAGWRDCSFAPGWVGCDPSSPSLPAWLAFFNPNGPAVIAIDLESESSWQVSQRPERMAWSPNGEQLLVILPGGQTVVYASDGEPLDQFAGVTEPDWQPDNSLGGEGQIRSADAREALLEGTGDLRWRLHVTDGTGVEPRIFDLEPQPGDRLYTLVGWVPGTDWVLGQFYSAGNAAMTQGARLFAFNTVTGERRDLDAAAPIGTRANFVWNDQMPLLAYSNASPEESGLLTLGLIDFATGQVRHPLPEGLNVGGLDWQPGGERLAFAASVVGKLDPPESASSFPGPAIYLLNPVTGETSPLTRPPSGARDDLPQFTPDGGNLLYARRFDSGVIEVHSLQLSDNTDRVILAGLPALCDNPEFGCDWQSWVAIGVKN